MHSSRSARLIGMIVFLLGIGLLVVVFLQARADLAKPLQGTSANIGLYLAQKLGFLFLMGYVASSLAGRGCQMFQSAGRSSVIALDEEPI